MAVVLVIVQVRSIGKVTVDNSWTFKFVKSSRFNITSELYELV